MVLDSVQLMSIRNSNIIVELKLKFLWIGSMFHASFHIKVTGYVRSCYEQLV